MRTRLIAPLVAALAFASPFACAQTGQVVAGKAPGVAGMARTLEVSAVITAIDPASRAITLKGPEGREKTIVAGPEVKNFAQLKVGDNVSAQFVEALVVELKKGSKAAPSLKEEKGAKGAPAGSTPGAVAGRRVTVVGEVLAVDAATQSVTVRGPKRTVDFTVADPEQFKLIAKGDRIEATYTEALAVAVTPKR